MDSFNGRTDSGRHRRLVLRRDRDVDAHRGRTHRHRNRWRLLCGHVRLVWLVGRSHSNRDCWNLQPIMGSHLGHRYCNRVAGLVLGWFRRLVRLCRNNDSERHCGSIHPRNLYVDPYRCGPQRDRDHRRLLCRRSSMDGFIGRPLRLWRRWRLHCWYLNLDAHASNPHRLGLGWLFQRRGSYVGRLDRHTHGGRQRRRVQPDLGGHPVHPVGDRSGRGLQRRHGNVDTNGGDTHRHRQCRRILRWHCDMDPHCSDPHGDRNARRLRRWTYDMEQLKRATPSSRVARSVRAGNSDVGWRRDRSHGVSKRRLLHRRGHRMAGRRSVPLRDRHRRRLHSRVHRRRPFRGARH